MDIRDPVFADAIAAIDTGSIDNMDQQPGPFNMAQEIKAKPGATMCALN